MTPCGVCHAAFDMNAGGKRRVHQDDGRADRTIEIVIDMSSVVLRHCRSGEELLQKVVADRRIPGFELPAAGGSMSIERRGRTASNAQAEIVENPTLF
jgi:hypothetical protein